MENFYYGRLSTLNYLKARRDDGQRTRQRRQQADKAIRQIVAQLRDRPLMKLRMRLIKAQQYGDLHAVWQIENQILTYEKRFELREAKEYTARDEDEV